MMLGYLLALVSSILWGLTYCLDQKVLSSVSPFQLFFLQSLSGVILSGGIWLMQGHHVRELFAIDTTQLHPKFLILTLFIATAAGLSIFGSIRLLGASRASLLEISYPFFVSVFTYLLFKEALTIQIAIGGLLIFIGSAVIVFWES